MPTACHSRQDVPPAGLPPTGRPGEAIATLHLYSRRGHGAGTHARGPHARQQGHTLPPAPCLPGQRRSFPHAAGHWHAEGAAHPAGYADEAACNVDVSPGRGAPSPAIHATRAMPQPSPCGWPLARRRGSAPRWLCRQSSLQRGHFSWPGRTVSGHSCYLGNAAAFPMRLATGTPKGQRALLAMQTKQPAT